MAHLSYASHEKTSLHVGIFYDFHDLLYCADFFNNFFREIINVKQFGSRMADQARNFVRPDLGPYFLQK